MSFGLIVPCIFLCIITGMINSDCFDVKDMTKKVFSVINMTLALFFIIAAFCCGSTKEFVFKLKNLGKDTLVVSYDAKYEDVQKLDLKKLFNESGYDMVDFKVYSYTGENRVIYSTVDYFGIKKEETYESLIGRDR